MVGQHCIYKILDTDMVYIPNEEATKSSGGVSSTFHVGEEMIPDIGGGVNGEKFGTSAQFGAGDYSGPHPDESRYYKMFNAIDLTSNFYYR